MPLVRLPPTETPELSSNPSSVASVVQALSASVFSKTARRHDKTTSAPIRGSSRSQTYRKGVVQPECPKGQTYYSCQTTGFVGCCSINPCNPSAVCPEAKDASSLSAGSSTIEGSASSTKSSPASSSAHSSVSKTSSGTAVDVSSGSQTLSRSTDGTGSGITKATGTLSIASVTVAAAALPTALLCPAGNGTTYSDNNKIDYSIHCNSDNSYEPYTKRAVQLGGYGQCFSSCSMNSTCAGFTFVGLDDGTCYFKSQLPSTEYLPKNGSNFITVAKVDPSAAAPQLTVPAAKESPPGAIIGGVVAGVVVLAAVLLLVAFFMRRKKKKSQAEQHAKITHVLGGAVEPDSQTLPMHQRQGITSHDVFAPYGGFYRGSQDAGHVGDSMKPRDLPYELSGLEPVGASRVVHAMPPAPLSADLPNSFCYEKDSDGLYMPPTIYRRPNQGSTDAILMLDSTPVSRPRSAMSNGSGSRFHEHIAELEGATTLIPPRTPPAQVNRVQIRLSTSIDADSPTLGRATGGGITAGNDPMADRVRRQQHLMSWNNYDDGAFTGHDHAGVRDGVGGLTATMAEPPRTLPIHLSPDTPKSGVSPHLSNSPLDTRFIVSPMSSQAKR